MPRAQALTSLQIFVPAAPGGGWDQTGRTIELAMRTDGIIKDFKFEHAPGAGGAVGLPRFVATKKGQGDALMVGGMVMVGALVANKSPVSMRELTPIARLTGEYEVIVVNAASPLEIDERPRRCLQGRSRARCRGPEDRPAAPTISWPA